MTNLTEAQVELKITNIIRKGFRRNKFPSQITEEILEFVKNNLVLKKVDN